MNKRISQYIVVIILGVLLSISGFLGYTLVNQKNDNQQPMTLGVLAKKYFFDPSQSWGWNFQLPENWSVYIAGDIDLTNSEELSRSPAYSVGLKNVSFGDINWEQVDFYYALTDITAELVSQVKAQTPNGWSREKVGGLEADVYTYPLDDGQVTKGGTGGKDYYLTVPGNNDEPVTLVIRKQALGSKDFENGFAVILSTFEVR